MIKVSNKCTACGACLQRCPGDCIRFGPDKNGFAMPIIDLEKCIDCGLCERVCHLNSKREHIGEQKSYAAVSKDNSILQRSTSGGAFTAIAEHMIKNGGVVYGCAYVDGLKAKHIRVENLMDLKKLNGSKYVRSEIDDCYIRTEKDLNAGLEVLFSGTPCQIAGLKTFLRKDYSNLLTADIVCHGVPEPAFFDKYIRWYEEKHGICLQDYDFRSKENAGWSLAGVCTGTDVKTKKKTKRNIYYFNEYYFNYFLSGDIYRECCYDCRYANLQRPGDFSLGDFWGIEAYTLPFQVNHGCSLLLVNTQKGHTMFEQLSLDKYEMPIEVAVANNAQLSFPSTLPASRDKILQQMNMWDAEQINAYFIRSKRLERFKGRIKYMLPPWLKTKLYRQRAKKNNAHIRK